MIKPGDEPIVGYRVEELLGRGQFGEVWRARSPGDTTVALKFLAMNGAHGWKEFRAIQRVKQIRHAHLMPIVAIWLLDEHGKVLGDDAVESMASRPEGAEPFDAGATLKAHPASSSPRPAQLIIATLLADQSLGDRLKRHQAEGRAGIPADELLGFMAEAAKGLDFLNSTQHKIGQTFVAVQHCDVKPDNIMLTGGSVVLADFGVAQTLALACLDATATSLGGTPAYMAPELFVNKPSRASDQYSLAVTYYELRTGKLPFEEQTYAAVFQAHREGTLDFSACKPTEREVLRRATATHPEERYKSCTEFVEKLGEGVRPAARVVSPAAPRSWQSAALVVLAVVAVASILGYGGYRWLDRPPATPMSRVTIVVDPADATISIDGRAVEADAGGQFVQEQPVGAAFVVKASRPPDRLDSELRIEPLEGDQRHELVLPFSAKHFADQALRLIGEGAVPPPAVESLAVAIEKEPDLYARLPEPVVALAGSDAVDLLCMSANGRRLAVASRDGSVRQWSIDAGNVGRTGATLHQHTGEIQSLATADDWTASFAEADGAIMLSHVDGRTLELRIPDSKGQIKQVAFADNGREIVAISEVLDLLPPVRRAWALHAWTLEADKVESSYREVASQDDESEPLMAAAHRAPWVAVASTDGEAWLVRICPLEGEPQAPVYSQAGDVNAIAISTDDRLVAIGGGQVSDQADLADYKATLIDVASGRSQVLSRAHRDSISTIAFDAAGKLLAAGDVDGNAHAWTIPEGWDGSTPPGAEPIFLPDGSADMSAISCPRPNWVACCLGGRVVLWDCQPGTPLEIELATPEDDATSMAATPDGRWLVTGHSDGKLRFWLLPHVILVERASRAAGEPLRTNVPPDNQATRSGRPSPSTRRSREENAGIAIRRCYRPSATPVG